MVKYIRENNEIKQIPFDCVKGAILLSKDEVERLLTREERKCTFEGRPCDWWIRTPCDSTHYVYTVDGVSGEILSDDGDYWVDDWACVRPALKLFGCWRSRGFDVGDMLDFCGYKFKIISNEYALCENAVDCKPFRTAADADDANIYEASDMKDYVDEWL